MLKDGKILVGKSGDKELSILLIFGIDSLVSTDSEKRL